MERRGWKVESEQILSEDMPLRSNKKGRQLKVEVAHEPQTKLTQFSKMEFGGLKSSSLTLTQTSQSFGMT